jgi:hypothetical protein
MTDSQDPICAICAEPAAATPRLVEGHSIFLCDECFGFSRKLERSTPAAPVALTCDFCRRPAEETLSFFTGAGGGACAECLHRMVTLRAGADPDYRAQLIERLAALADTPWPPESPDPPSPA